MAEKSKPPALRVVGDACRFIAVRLLRLFFVMLSKIRQYPSANPALTFAKVFGQTVDTPISADDPQ
jgi:hypothetical protein